MRWEKKFNAIERCKINQYDPIIYLAGRRGRQMGRWYCRKASWLVGHFGKKATVEFESEVGLVVVVVYKVRW